MNSRIGRFQVLAFGLALACAVSPAHADKKPQQDVKPMAGPRATALRITWLYISPDTGSEKVDKEQIGREMVVAEKSGSWMQRLRQHRHRGAAQRQRHADGGRRPGASSDYRVDRSQRSRRRVHAQRRSDSDGRGRQSGGPGFESPRPGQCRSKRALALPPRRRNVSQFAAGAGSRLAHGRHSMAA